MRDYTDLLHLVILNNLQNTNAELIEEKELLIDYNRKVLTENVNALLFYIEMERMII